MSKLYLGIDTSNYKTSVSIVDENWNILFNRSEFLDVKAGEKGLRQSDAFFMHSNKLPEFIEDAFSVVDPRAIAAIGVSTRPRRVEGSYMPCFLAGYNLAKELGSVLSIPVHQFSHQEGHAAAVMSEQPELFDQRTILFHLSGGTTEYLVCKPDCSGFMMEIVGGTKDISYGQLLDRVGVKMGLPFPSGKYLDDIAVYSDISSATSDQISKTKQLITKQKIEDCHFNLSGLETKLTRYIDINPGEIETNLMIRYLFGMIADMLLQSAYELKDKFNIETVLMAGGVSASKYIRNRIKERDNTNSIVFCAPELSGDNAVGVAVLSQRMTDK